MSIRTIGIARHGKTRLNEENKIRSWIDIPLNAEGVEEARRLGEELRVSADLWDGIVSSDLVRSVQTSVEISAIANIPILELNEAFRPINVGSLSGADGELANSIIMDHAINTPGKPIGGGESFNTFKRRVLLGLKEAIQRYADRRIIISTHTRCERLFNAWAKTNFSREFEIDILEFGQLGIGTATIQTLEIRI